MFTRDNCAFIVCLFISKVNNLWTLKSPPPLVLLLWISFLSQVIIGKLHTQGHTLTLVSFTPPQARARIQKCTLLSPQFCWQQQTEFLRGRKWKLVCVRKLSSHEARYVSCFLQSITAPLAAIHGIFIPNQHSPSGYVSK